MRNVCLDVALFELDQAGVRDVKRVRGSKHLQLRWQINSHGLRVYTIPGSPSDWRAPKNVRSDIRRMLREDGIAVASKLEASPSPSPPPPPPTAPLSDRVAELERRVARLERKLEEERQSHHNG